MGFEKSNSIGLIIPPSVFLLDERVFASLGILKVAAVLEQAGHEVEVLDLSGIVNYETALQDYLAASSCSAFGITATTPQFPQVSIILRIIRTYRPDARVILGGPHVTLIHTAARKELARGREGRAVKALRSLESDFDVLVSGDGEKAVFVALDDDPPALVDANELTSPLFLTRAEYERSPLPARHLLDLHSYHYTIDGHRATSIIGQLGCPFSCGFCGGRESPCLRVVRNRSTQSVLNEIETIYREYGFTGYMFYDDELNVNPRFMELIEGLIRLQIRLDCTFHFRGFVKAELFTRRHAEALYAAGFRWILSGFETGSSRMLVNINKRATREDNSRCIEIAHEFKLKVKALMSIGHPGESPATIAKTRDWLLQVKPDDADITIITPYPGTSYYDRALPLPGTKDTWVYTVPATGDKLYCRDIDYGTVAAFYKGDPGEGYRALTSTDYLSSQDLVTMRSEMEREVRAALHLGDLTGTPALRYEHSMGQMGEIPPYILRSSLAHATA
ncbi:MAG: B12-binding domain-containing radical SAM protein [Chitinispirillaceae bacterium]|nr:B12-binding domain-containing radical SAM protein [Chitinispirillaceae bacterium]